jgi:hypothetical protein
MVKEKRGLKMKRRRKGKKTWKVNKKRRKKEKYNQIYV